MLKIVKKEELSSSKIVLLRIIAVIIALICSTFIIFLLGHNPFEVFSNIIAGATGTEYRIIQTINKAIPLTTLSLGIAVAFKMRFWNIGAEGQFYVGALGATFVTLNFGELPAIILIPFMMIVACIFGGLWCLFPAVLKSKLGTSETLVTLMMNYIAIKWVTYLQFGPWKDPEAFGFPKIAKFTSNAILPKVFNVHIGWIITLFLAIIVHFLLSKSKLGYEIEVLGENENTANYAGMNVSKILIVGAMISGGICGLAGMMQASAIENSLTYTLSAGLGFTAIITAWLAKLSAPAIVLVSMLFSILLQGGSYLQTSMQIPASLSELLQGIILLFVLGSEFFINYKIVREKNEQGGNV